MFLYILVRFFCEQYVRKTITQSKISIKSTVKCFVWPTVELIYKLIYQLIVSALQTFKATHITNDNMCTDAHEADSFIH